MLKRPWFPLFAVVFPIASLFSANVNIVPIQDALRPAAVVLVATILLWCLTRLIFKSWIRSGVFTTVVVVGFLEFGGYNDWTLGQNIDTWPALNVGYGVMILVLALVFAWKVKTPDWLNVLCVGAFCIAAFTGITHYVQGFMAIQSIKHQESSGASKNGPRPDVFYIIVDGYGRSDSVKKYIGYDNTPFINGLKQEGFFVADQGRSNYCQTELSISSSLNMDYLQNMLPPGHEDESERLVFQNMIQDSRVEQEFEKLGYITVAVTTGFPAVQFPHAGFHAEGNTHGLTLFESAIYENTPLRARRDVMSTMYDRRRDDLTGALTTLRNLATPSPRPRLVLAHVLAPHPPFVISAQGTPVRSPGPFAYFDGSDYMAHNGTSATYAEGYSQQAQYLSGRLLEIVHNLTHSSKQPIVIIQGDHGSKRFLVQDDMAKTQLTEVFPNLNAYYVPDAIRQQLKPDMTPVNSFRLILSYLGHTDLPPLENHTYWSPFTYPRKFVDVTNKSQLSAP